MKELGGMVGFKRLYCNKCEKVRWHEIRFDMGLCKAPDCGWQRFDGDHISDKYKEPFENSIERFVK